MMGLLAGCHDKPAAQRVVVNVVDLPKDTLTSWQKTMRDVRKDLPPIMGYRFVIVGDFNGDGKLDTLAEHYTSGVTGRESNKFYDSLGDYGDLVALAVLKEPYSFVLSNDKRMDTLRISQGGQLLGLSYLKNEGDLDGDGADEVSFLVNAADWSSVSTYHIASYKKGRWREIYSFGVWDWQFPPLPDYPIEYGLFGVDGGVSAVDNDTINKQIRKELEAFPGMIKKVRTNVIRIRYRDSAAEEKEMVVDLRKTGYTSREIFNTF